RSISTCRRRVEWEFRPPEARPDRLPQERHAIDEMTWTIPFDRRGCGHGAGEKVGDVFGTDRVLLHAAREGGAHGVVPIGGEQAMEAIDVAQPDLRPSMRELRDVRERVRPKLQQVLALQIALGPFAGYRRDVLRAMLGENRALARLEFPLVRHLEAARDDLH